MSKPRSTKSDDEHRDHSGGGPGSSHQGGSHGHASREAQGPAPDEPTNTRKSRTSGGGGERDSHHTHAAEQKGDRKGM